MPVLTLAEAVPRLRTAHAERRLIPFLGAGFSAPLGLPLWNELMGWMGTSLGYEPALFELHGLSSQLAGYFALEHDGGLPWFIARMRERFHDEAADDRRRSSLQHQALAHCDFRTIYTTNFERHIEGALTDAGKRAITLARLADFMRPVDAGACQVIKFHGDLEFPETVVLTEAHYFDRFRLEAAPDQRLRSDMLGNVFLFLGYSFSDVNIRYIWYRMNQMRRDRQPQQQAVAPDFRCYWATFGAGLVQPRLLEDWHIDVIALDPSDKGRSVAQLLGALQPGDPR